MAVVTSISESRGMVSIDVDGSTLLKELPSYQTNYYLTVFFEGDQEGAPMYIQLSSFVGYVDLGVGTHHSIG